MWIELIATIEAGANRAVENILLMVDGRFMCLFYVFR